MLTAQASYPSAQLPGASVRPIFALLAVLAVAVTCGAPSYLKKAPASELQLAIQLDNALVAGDAPVQITVRVDDPSSNVGVALSDGQRLTCGGVSDPGDEAFQHAWDVARFLVPRQPPGGAYTCVYTDESGQQTTATIPVPLAPLAFISPTAGAHVPIPTSLEPQPVASPPAFACVFNTQLRQPLLIHYTFPVPPGYTPPLPSQSFPLPSWPAYNDFAVQKPYAIVTAQAGYGVFSPLPGECGESSGPGQAATGTYALSLVVNYSSYQSDQFERFVPEPGYIMLNLAMQWLPPAGGFHAILVNTQDSLTIPITWTTP